MKLNEEQQAALEAMVDFIHKPLAETGHFFLLKGQAGTGKTFCIRELIGRVKGKLVFTAPTNKATKVIRDTLTSTDYTPECRTIYSLLGLQLKANGEVKVLAEPEEPIELAGYRAIIVDEASMVNAALFKFIELEAEDQNLKFIFIGDENQLPPIGEPLSKTLLVGNSFELQKVMRHDNQILDLASTIRKLIPTPAPSIKFRDSFNEAGGVWSLSQMQFEARILVSAEFGRFHEYGKEMGKVIAWRNVAVDDFNKKIRLKVFGEAAETPWLVGDRIIATELTKNTENRVIASTDDEGVIGRTAVEYHPVWPEFKVWVLTVTLDDNRTATFLTLHKDSAVAHARKIVELSDAAKRNPRLWRDFWEFKEAFHGVRHAYAITAHRAQGSTYHTAFVCWRDILLNKNRQEGFKCLYVACTRPTTKLFLG